MMKTGIESLLRGNTGDGPRRYSVRDTTLIVGVSPIQPTEREITDQIEQIDSELENHNLTHEELIELRDKARKNLNTINRLLREINN